ncbi:MICOS complex subunit MIC60 [Oryzias melastigma]|uniref:MICOS complex subunit MIC60 n=1 Tax=Oryzias melastigma TaxID=30732 RepID=A0A834L0H6_ORYME|nr:MICOS complex subunit MIC60 [Oryzias melastigma]
MLRLLLRGAAGSARKNGGRGPVAHLQPLRQYSSSQSSGAAKVVAASLLTVGGGIGGTVLYAQWDHKFRATVEKNVPYSDSVFGLILGPAPQNAGPPVRKQVRKSTEASVEATQIISASGDVPSVPAPCDTEPTVVTGNTHEHCDECHPAGPEAVLHGADSPTEQLVERPAEEVSARLAQQDQDEQNSPPEEKSVQWKDLEAALMDRTSAVTDATAALQKANEALDSLRTTIRNSKDLKVAAARPLVLAAEENLHKMAVDLDRVVAQVQSAEAESKIVSQYSDLVQEAKLQFQKEVSSLTPEIQANWKGLTGKLSTDDLNALIAHAHRRIDQLNRELAEQRVREQIHIDAALQQQKLEDQRVLENAVSSSLQHVKEEARLEQERKMNELREVMEAEMRTQLRRQAAAHTDHVRDVLKVQEQELRAEAEQVLSSKLLDQETRHRQLTQEQLDNFTLDMNAAYARLKGVEEAIDSHLVAEDEARRAHQLWLSVEALNHTLKTAGAEEPSVPLDSAAQIVRDSCREDDFASALAEALPAESLSRGVYGEASLRARFNSLRSLVRRVALIDESHNSLYQYFLSYLQAALLFEDQQVAPPTQLSSEDLDPFKLLSYASYCLEHGELELAAKLVNQLKGEARRVVEDWLTEARLTLETRQVVSLLSAYANAVGLGTTQAP